VRKFDRGVHGFSAAYSKGNPSLETIAAMREHRAFLNKATAAIHKAAADIGDPGARVTASRIAEQCRQQAIAVGDLLVAVEAGDSGAEAMAHAELVRVLQVDAAGRLGSVSGP
jgi:hypothetical protein